MKIRTFTAGAGALRNTSTDGAETAGSRKGKDIVVSVHLACPQSETRVVEVDLMTHNHVGGAPPLVLEFGVERVMRGGETARFKFFVAYDARSCANGEGPVPKDQGGVNQVNVGAFTFTAMAYSDDDAGNDPGPNASSGAATADLICKPSRTTL